jgi:hypothetical protein
MRYDSSLGARLPMNWSGADTTPDVGPAEARIELDVRRLTVDPSGPSFQFHGFYEAEGTAEAAIQNPRNDSGTSWVQRDADDRGEFIAHFFPDDAPDVIVDYIELRKVHPQSPRWTPIG